MLTRKPYLIGSFCFLLLLVAFQFFSMNMGFEGDHFTHRYDQARADALMPVDVPPQAPAYYLVGQEDDPAFLCARWMLARLKLPYSTADQLDAQAYASAPQTLLLAADMAALGEENALRAYLRAGGQVIFLRLPDDLPKAGALLDDLGILSVGESITCEQMEIYEGLLLGGMVRYKELPFTGRRLRLNSLCKVWACMWEGDPNRRTLEVPLLYEKRVGEGIVHVANGPFFEDASGIGLLTGLLAIPREAFLYPVVNAMTVSLVNFPLLTADSPAIRDVYARNAYQVCRDVFWPDLASALRENRLTATAFVPDMAAEGRAGELAFFLRALSDHHGEIGLTAPMTGLPEIAERYPDYGLFAALGEAVNESIRCVVRPLSIQDAGFSLDGSVLYPLLTQGHAFDEAENLRLRGFASGLYLIHHGVDMSLPLLLAEPDHAWQQMSRDLASTLNDSMAPYPAMRRRNASAASVDMLAYGRIQPAIEGSQAGLSIQSGLAAETCFLLRTKREIASAQGLAYTRVEKGVYLLTLSGSSASLTWKEASAP